MTEAFKRVKEKFYSIHMYTVYNENMMYKIKYQIMTNVNTSINVNILKWGGEDEE